jgi:tRNA (mo5U34)-methyltransferase
VIREALLDYLAAHGLVRWAEHLRAQSDGWLVGHGDYPRWSAALESLPALDVAEARFDLPEVTLEADCADLQALRRGLEGLIPWRKGPFRIAGLLIDSEWRSDYKWQRVAPGLAALEGRRILDIGCGNGYYGWRMLAQSPRLVIGVEPSVLFNLQFMALQNYLDRDDIHLLPIGVEDIPADLEWFDTVFSMGVLYHRKSPLDHLFQLGSLLRGGGQLCLETLVIDAPAGRVLLPRDRYARMRNVWFIPSTLELVTWLERSGFIDVEIVDESVTSTGEQRSTPWMRFESLAECLDPADPTRTVEGLPAPRRAVVVASKPGG